MSVKPFGTPSGRHRGIDSVLRLKLPSGETVNPQELWLRLAQNWKQNLETTAAPSEKGESLQTQARALDIET